jgi:hypothetical protein
MQYKNILWLFLLFLAICGFDIPQRSNVGFGTKKWVVRQNSSLRVNGSTNINKFSCVIPAYDQIDTLTFNKNKTGNGVILTGSIGLNINSFDCHNSAMTKQLQKTMKEKQFPVLHIKFLSLNKLPELSTVAEMITGQVAIEIAGVSKHFEVKYQISQDDQKIIHLLGSRDINFSDFNLVPPRKLGGMIKTRDELSVDFHLNMKTMD